MSDLYGICSTSRRLNIYFYAEMFCKILRKQQELKDSGSRAQFTLYLMWSYITSQGHRIYKEVALCICDLTVACWGLLLCRPPHTWHFNAKIFKQKGKGKKSVMYVLAVVKETLQEHSSVWNNYIFRLTFDIIYPVFGRLHQRHKMKGTKNTSCVIVSGKHPIEMKWNVLFIFQRSCIWTSVVSNLGCVVLV